MFRRPPATSLFPYTTLFRSSAAEAGAASDPGAASVVVASGVPAGTAAGVPVGPGSRNRWLPVCERARTRQDCKRPRPRSRSEEHTSELQSRGHLVCRLLLEK